MTLEEIYGALKQMDLEMIPILKAAQMPDARAHLSNHHLQLSIYYLAQHLKSIQDAENIQNSETASTVQNSIQSSGRASTRGKISQKEPNGTRSNNDGSRNLKAVRSRTKSHKR